jgi:hypothetical protein
MIIDVDNLLPPGRTPIHLELIFDRRNHPLLGPNPCCCVSLKEPANENRKALLAGIRKILPFIYRSPEEATRLLFRYGMDVKEAIPKPDKFRFRWAHAGEILMCSYFEEVEQMTVYSYKWRLSTTGNQHQYGMDLLAFDTKTNPPTIYLVAVKTTKEGGDGQIPTVVYSAIRELDAYLKSDKLDDDLEIISSNLHTDETHKQIFLSWYDPYTQGIAGVKPRLVPVPGIVADAAGWNDRYAKPAIEKDFGVPGAVRVLCINELEELVNQVYA